MVKNTALNKLMNGDKVRVTKWDKKRFILVDDKGQIVDNEGKTFNMMASKDKAWELFKEPISTSTGGNTKELEKMIKLLTDEVKGLKETTADLQQAVNNQDCTTRDIDSSDVADEVIHAVDDKIEQAIKDNMPQEERTHEETVKIFYGVSSLKEVRESFKTELLNCKEKKETLLTVTKFIPYCWMGGRKIKTVARYYADMRNVIKDVADEYQDIALDLFSVPTDVYERIKKADTEKVLEKLDQKEVFDINQMRNIITSLKGNIETVMELGEDATIEDYKNNNVPVGKQQTEPRIRAYLYASYLALVTGRRITEILKTLTLVKKKNEWIFGGITKKKGGKVELKAFVLDNDYDFLNTVLNQIRQDINTTKMQNTEVNSKFNHIFNRSFQRISGTKYTFHDLREIYSELAYIDYGNKKGTEREEVDFKSEILGHEVDKNRLISTEHYMTKKGK